MSFVTAIGAGMTVPCTTWQVAIVIPPTRATIPVNSQSPNALKNAKVKFFPLFFRVDYHFTPLEVCNLAEAKEANTDALLHAPATSLCLCCAQCRIFAEAS